MGKPNSSISMSEGVAEEVVSLSPRLDVDVVWHWLASSSVVGDPCGLNCMVEES